MMLYACAPAVYVTAMTENQQKCGDTFYGDVHEYRAGGVARLIERMQRSMSTRVTATKGSAASNKQRYIVRLPDWMKSALHNFSGRSNSQTPALPTYNDSGVTLTGVPINNPSVPQQTLHVMACMQRGRYRHIVRQDCIEGVTTDRALFSLLRTQLARHRGRMRKLFSLKSVQGLYFVKVSTTDEVLQREHYTKNTLQFRLRACGSAEVRDHELCCISYPSRACDCIPPADKVEPAPDAEYRCDPAGPLDWWPPILSQELMHMLTSPDCIHEGETSVLEQLPKRTCGAL